jgi:glycosyltransferase involved in cell wall biosynthesis
MAAGVPVVATRVGGIPDTVSSDEALLVSSEDPNGLAAAIDLVRTDLDGAQSRARSAERRFQAVCAPGPWVNAYLELYREVALGH